MNVPRVVRHGGSAMRFVECIDEGAKTDVIAGIASFTLIGPGTIEIAYYRYFETISGSVERRIVRRLVCDRAQWAQIMAVLTQAMATVNNCPFVDPLGEILMH